MIYPDYMLRKWCEAGGVSPYQPENINPASIDLTWSGRYKLAHVSGWGDMIDADSLIVEPGRLYLLDTAEYIGMPLQACGVLYLKSSMGRRGFEHLHAGFVDPGFTGNLTLEVINCAPWNIVLSRGQRIIQLQLQQMIGVPDKSYLETGRYNYQVGPTEAR